MKIETITNQVLSLDLAIVKVMIYTQWHYNIITNQLVALYIEQNVYKKIIPNMKTILYAIHVSRMDSHGGWIASSEELANT